MKKMTLCLTALTVLAGCSSFKPDYVITDASEKTPPAWLVVPEKAAKDKSELTKYRFYVSDAEHKNQRLCEQQANAQATQEVASEISQNITSAFEAAYSGTDETATGKLKDTLQRSINQNLHGVAVAKKYWQKRQYLQELGAEEDKTVFKCYASVKVTIKDLEKAIKDAKAAAVKTLPASEQKAVSDAIDTVTGALKAAETGSVADVAKPF